MAEVAAEANRSELFDACYIVSRTEQAYGADEGRQMMFGRAMKAGAIDRLAIGLSGFCLIHCVASAVLVAVLASAGGILLDPIIHEVGLVLALGLGIVGLGKGILDHGYMMPAAIGSLGLGVMAGALTLGHENGGTLYAIIGVLVLALGHDLNRRAVI
jgi:hypothetical protein